MVNRNMKCVAIHDMSGVGKCSLTIALPVLSACGVETSVMPTAVLSTHTGGFTDYVYIDLTDKMLPMAEHWKSVGCSFDAIYTGFLGSDQQIEIINKIFDMYKNENNLIVMDPVMGDHGKLYPTYTEAMADGIAKLCSKADIIAPNMTEAARILGIEYAEGPYTKEFVSDILKKLCAIGPSKVVLTGIWFEEGKLGSACRDNELDEERFVMFDKIDGYFHGTGDLFASVLTGGILNGLDVFDAAKAATEYTWKTIVTTAEAGGDYRFGPKFEVHLPEMAAFMQEQRNKTV